VEEQGAAPPGFLVMAVLAGVVRGAAGSSVLGQYMLTLPRCHRCKPLARHHDRTGTLQAPCLCRTQLLLIQLVLSYLLLASVPQQRIVVGASPGHASGPARLAIIQPVARFHLHVVTSLFSCCAGHTEAGPRVPRGQSSARDHRRAGLRVHHVCGGVRGHPGLRWGHVPRLEQG
jgi:hypothetical protein